MALSNLVLADAQATPVNHTFIPLGANDPNRPNRLIWEDQSAVSPLGYWHLWTACKRPAAPSPGVSSRDRIYRLSGGIDTAILETLGTSTITGIPASPTVAHIPRAEFNLLIPERATTQQVNDLWKILTLFMASSPVSTLVSTRNNPI